MIGSYFKKPKKEPKKNVDSALEVVKSLTKLFDEKDVEKESEFLREVAAALNKSNYDNIEINLQSIIKRYGVSVVANNLIDSYYKRELERKRKMLVDIRITDGKIRSGHKTFPIENVTFELLSKLLPDPKDKKAWFFYEDKSILSEKNLEFVKKKWILDKKAKPVLELILMEKNETFDLISCFENAADALNKKK